jgi:glycosyltransferase involved in cell wall biosynthesis
MDSGIPLVSIGMPVYNGAKSVRKALDSLLAQDYDNYEIIISDNASTDQTPKILKEYASKYPHIKIYTQPENVGILENFRKVLRLARGKYFMWAADDDYWEPEFLKILVNALESDRAAGVALCAVRRENPDGSLKDIIRFYKNYNTSILSHWQVALLLLSPKKQIKMLKYNLFICGLFKYGAISELLYVKNCFFRYDERATLFPIALAHKFLYIDEILFSKTVHSAEIRHPNNELRRIKSQTHYIKYWSKFYYRVSICTIKYSQIPLHRKFFVLFLPYWIYWRFAYRQKKRVKKLFYGKNS